MGKHGGTKKNKQRENLATTEKLIKILLIKTTTLFALYIKMCIVWSFVSVFVILFRSLLFAKLHC